jgi:serine/threonine-protein kinase
MAAVYVARRVEGPRCGELVAIKTIRGEYASSRDFVTMFIDEAKIVSRMRHPNVVRYLELGEDRGQSYLVMELLFGQSLWSLWDTCRARGRKLEYSTLAWIGARVASGLHYVHELRDSGGKPLDVVHRDVNATNIFVTYTGEVKVIDFGLAKAADRASTTAAGIVKGKVAYMSPEQAVGAAIDRRTDVFALGATLWEIGCDRRLFKANDDVETLRRVHAAVVPDPSTIVPDFPAGLWRVLRRALARDREHRHANAAEFARELDTFAIGAAGHSAAAGASVAKRMRDLYGPPDEASAALMASAVSPVPLESEPSTQQITQRIMVRALSERTTVIEVSSTLPLVHAAAPAVPALALETRRARLVPLLVLFVAITIATYATLVAICGPR